MKRMIIAVVVIIFVIGLLCVPTFASEVVSMGDFNKDGRINTMDAFLLYKHTAGQVLLTDEQLSAADINYDGVVNMVDTMRLYHYAQNGTPLPTITTTTSTTTTNTTTTTTTTDISKTTATTTTTMSTKPEHSELYLSEVSVNEVVTYFNEVCLDAEYVSNGNPNVVQKWTQPIYYMLYGEYTSTDLQILTAFVNQLNDIEGFPGMYRTTVDAQANMRIHFCDYSQMVSLMGNVAYGADGAVTFWYSNNEIYDAMICVRKDISQIVRNSVIMEEIYNGLGPVQDTSLREDSLIYAGYSEPQQMTSVDKLILELLYHPSITCGMSQTACERVIRQLYY